MLRPSAAHYPQQPSLQLQPMPLAATATAAALPVQFLDDACLPNPIRYGAASVAFRCAQPAKGGVSNPTGLNSRIVWYETANCRTDATSSPSVDHRTVVQSRAGICHKVPDSQTSYQVLCNTLNTGGQIAFCTDYSCANCNVKTPFE